MESHDAGEDDSRRRKARKTPGRSTKPISHDEQLRLFRSKYRREPADDSELDEYIAELYNSGLFDVR